MTEDLPAVRTQCAARLIFGSMLLAAVADEAREHMRVDPLAVR